MDFVAGIDVGAAKKGFHLSIKRVGEESFLSLANFKQPEDVVGYLKGFEMLYKGRVKVIAIDCPPKAVIDSEETRLAEREVVKRGYKVLWTPRSNDMRQSWMVNGEKLWEHLRVAIPEIELVESFPTVNSDLLIEMKERLPLSLLNGKSKRKFYGDYIDASICALVAEKRFLQASEELGPDDQLGAIHILPVKRRLFVLGIIRQGDRVLLGYKKKGFGAERWNGFGGKVEEQDRPRKGQKKGALFENAVRREVKEEAGIDWTGFYKAGLIEFSFEAHDEIMEVHVFYGGEFEGEPGESDEMIPRWFSIDEIPYEEMWIDDIVWLPLLLKGKRFKANFSFKDYETLQHYSIEECAKL